MSARIRSLAVLIAMTLLATPVLPREAPQHLVEHMKIQLEVAKRGRPAPSFSVRVGPITSLVPLKGHYDADQVFGAPFVDELRDGIAYYLSQKGVKVVDGVADLQVAGRIIGYEDFRGGGEHGAEVRMLAAFLRHGQKVYEQEVKSLFKFRGEGEATDKLKPVYKAKTGSKSIEFPEVLFTKIAADLGEKIYIVLDQERKSLVSLGAPDPGASRGTTGRMR